MTPADTRGGADIERQTHAKILIAESDAAIRHFLSVSLADRGYAVVCAANGREALSLCLSHNPDLLLLALPDAEGMGVLREVHAWLEAPVIVLSARQAERDKIAALDAGAHDYVTQPFGSGELFARIRAALRSYKRLPVQGGDGKLAVGGLRIDDARRRVEVDGAPIRLTPTEYRIVLLLAANAGKVLTREGILREVWGAQGGDHQTLRVNIANIRRKMERDPARPVYIITETGVGYRLADGSR